VQQASETVCLSWICRLKLPTFDKYAEWLLLSPNTQHDVNLWRRQLHTSMGLYALAWALKSYMKVVLTVPDMASYIRGWIQMVLAPNDLFSWITDTFTCFFLAMHTTYSVHAGILKPWRGRLPWPLVVFSFYHVLSLPLSRLNWRSLFPPWGSGPPFPKMAPPFTGSAHTPLPGSGTVSVFC
jgi:hypothetical protein